MSGKRKFVKHKTVDNKSQHEIRWIEKIQYVNKVVLGRVDPFMHHLGQKVKIIGEVPGGIQLKFFIEGGCRPIFLSVEREHSQIVLMALKKRFE